MYNMAEVLFEFYAGVYVCAHLCVMCSCVYRTETGKLNPTFNRCHKDGVGITTDSNFLLYSFLCF